MASDSIKLKSGKRVSGQATAYDGEAQILSFRTDAGEDLTFPLDQLDARSVYQVTRSKVEKDNAKGQLQLANYARDIHLYKHARRHYDYAEKADPSLAPAIDGEIAVARTRAAEWCMEQARAAVEAQDFDKAEEWLTTMINKLPNEARTAEAKRMLEDYYNRTHSIRDDELEKEAAELLTNDLKKGKTYYDRMIERNGKGLMTDSGGKARREFENAVSDGERVLKELDRVEKKRPEHAATIAGYRELVIQQIIEVRLNLASQYMVSTNYNSALSEVNQAIVLDPSHGGARSMRARIEEASSRGWDWF